MEKMINKEEILAVYSPEGDVLEGGVPRTLAHEKGILHGASHIYICKREDGVLYVLLQRRSEGKDSFPGCLDASSAGHVEFGSNHLETAIKELKEELGLSVSPLELRELFLQRIDQESSFYGKPFLDREINRVYLLIADPVPTALSLQASEVSEVVWLSCEEILARLDAGDTGICLNHAEFRRVWEMAEKYI